MALEPLSTADDLESPTCVQLSVFLENRVGQLLRLTRLFDKAPVHILGISVENASDCAIVRLLFDDIDKATEMLTDARFAFATSEVLVVQLPSGKRGMMAISQALISGEVNINYVYPMIATESRPCCLIAHVDNISLAASNLMRGNFVVLDQSQL